jgi:hypothetical protein
LSNNEWAAQRRGGASESRANNVIYIGRASFRMEPAPLLADDLDDGVQGIGEDIEPPFLKLRTNTDESDADASSGPAAGSPSPELDLTEFAVAEKTGVEPVPPPFPRAVAPTLLMLPEGFLPEPATETILRPKKVLLSRARLIGWGALAFSAGLVASAGAHMLGAPTAASVQAAAPSKVATPPAIASVTAPVPAPAPTPAPPVAAVEAPAAGPAAADPAHLVLAAAMPGPSLHTRAGAAPQSRGKTRARGKSHSEPRSGGSTATADAETDWAPASASPATVERPAPTPAARAAAPHGGAGWVDPFAE